MNSVWRAAVILFISIAKMGFEQKGLPSPSPQPFVYQADGIIIFVF